MPLVDIGPMELIAASLELVPLQAGVQHMQDVIEDLIEGELRSWTFHGSVQVRSDVTVEVLAGNLFGQRMAAEGGWLWSDWFVHKNHAERERIHVPTWRPPFPLL